MSARPDDEEARQPTSCQVQRADRLDSRGTAVGELLRRRSEVLEREADLDLLHRLLGSITVVIAWGVSSVLGLTHRAALVMALLSFAALAAGDAVRLYGLKRKNPSQTES